MLKIFLTPFWCSGPLLLGSSLILHQKKSTYEQFSNYGCKLIGEENMHKLGIFLLKQPYWFRSLCGLVSYQKKINLNVGLAAGFDKQAECIEGLFDIGFDRIECGSVTCFPQLGNIKDKKKCFRLEEDHAIINRYGIPSDGMETIYQRLLLFQSTKKKKHKEKIIGININPLCDNINDQYFYKQVKKISQVVDYITINGSCPNLSSLTLQENPDLIFTLFQRLSSVSTKPIFLKLSSDLQLSQKLITCLETCKKENYLHGVIIGNSVKQWRPSLNTSLGLKSKYRHETGGLSGKPIRDLSTEKIRQFKYLTGGRIPIIGCGGIFTKEDVKDKMKAGATSVQLYTSFVFGGKNLLERLKEME